MPELPEVETVRRTLLPLLKGRTIQKVEVFYPKAVHVDLETFKKSLENKRILDIERKGKHLIFVLSNGLYLLSHLRMEGRYRVENEGFQPQKHDLLYFHLDESKVLCYHDTRKFGVFLLKDKDSLWSTPPLLELGKEPFEMKEEELQRLLKAKRGNVKEALLDQKTICGIGNIYADEILIHSKINPFRKANTLSMKECENLLYNAKEILSEAIKEGGSTVRSYHPLDGIDGRMQLSLWAYGREGKPCPYCGLPLKKSKVNGRGTTYCPHCQVPPEEKIVIGVTGPIASGKSTVSKYIERKGYLRFDCDAIVHLLYEKKNIQKKLQEAFGNQVVQDGRIDRKFLLGIVSKDRRKRQDLESIIHPMVYKAIEEGIKKTKQNRIVLDVPLLFGSPLEKLCNATILVTAKDEIRMKRLEERGVDIHKSLSLNEDYPLSEGLKKATIHLETKTTPLLELYKQIDKIRFLD